MRDKNYDGDTPEEKQRFTRIQFAKDKGIHWQCTECDLEAYVKDDPVFDHCRDMNHFVEKFITETPAQEKARLAELNKKMSLNDIVRYIMANSKFVTLTKTHEILRYDHGVYLYGAEETISRDVRMLEPQVTTHDIKEIIAIIHDKTGYRSLDEFDSDVYLINTRTGIVDIRTGLQTEHSPDHLSRVQLPVSWNCDTVPWRFLKFIRTSQPSPRSVYRIMEMMGACLIRDNHMLTKSWIHLGDGSNGKSILFRILGAILGKANLTHHTIQEIEMQRFVLASLDGKLANICGDIEEDELRKTGSLKKVIAGDPINAEKKFLPGYSYEPYCKLIFSANQLPKTPDETDGFSRRFEFIDWPMQFYGKDRDDTVNTIEDDQDELDGIFRMMVFFAKDILTRRGLRYETDVRENRLLWKERSNVVERFINNFCKVDPEYRIEKVRFQDELRKYCVKTKIKPWAAKAIRVEMEKQGYFVKKISGEYYMGICLKTDGLKDGQGLL